MGILSWLRREPPAQKASSVGRLIVVGVQGRPAWPGGDYARMAKEGYQQNPVVYACVRLIAESVASLRLIAYRRQRNGKKVEIDDCKTLALLDRPNPVLKSRAMFFRQYVTDQKLTGNVFVERVDGMGREPKELYFWRPDRTRIVPGPVGWPEAYEYRAGGQVRRVAVDVTRADVPILHMRDVHPLDDWYGMPPIDPAAYAINTHTGASAWNMALLDNGARPPGALMYKGDGEGGNSLSEEQFRRLKADIETKFSGQKNAGKPLLLEGGLEWQAMGFDAVEMDFVAGKNEAARDIARVFGVPPMMLGIPGDNTYSNYQEAREAFYSQTVVPIMTDACQALAGWLGPSLGEEGLCLEPDEDEIPALSKKRAEKWTQVQAADFLSIDEKREATGYEALPDKQGEVVLVQSTLVSLEDAGASLTGGEEPDGDEAGEAEAGAGDRENDGDA